MPNISVLVNSWNGLNYLKLFCESLFKTESYEDGNIEICIALDGCDDGSKEYVKTINARWCWNEHRGISFSMNRAAELARGEYWFWASNDYVFPPNWYKNLSRYLDPNHFISIDTVEPYSWSVQPYANFGETPQTFRYNDFCEYTTKIRPNLIANRIGYVWGNGVVHHTKWPGFDVAYDPYGVMDDDFIYSVFESNPDMLFFCPNDVSVYHFGSATIKDKKHIIRNDLTQTFETKHHIAHAGWNKHIEIAMENKYRSFNFLNSEPKVIGHKRRPGVK